MTFARDVRRWIDTTKLDGATVVRKLALDAYTGILLRSIVDTGRFRASHRIGINSVDPSVAPERTGSQREKQFSPPDPAELATGTATLATLRWGDTVYITNSLPYAQKLENGGSAQNGNAVDGIYGATFAELIANLDRSIRQATL